MTVNQEKEDSSQDTLAKKLLSKTIGETQDLILEQIRVLKSSLDPLSSAISPKLLSEQVTRLTRLSAKLNLQLSLGQSKAPSPISGISGKFGKTIVKKKDSSESV